jgi:hypothetical protein
MSHLVTIKTRLRDPDAIAAACRRLNLAPAVQGTASVYNTEATGLMVQLPGWRYPAVVNTQTGEVHYDNFGGTCGEQKELDRFLQMYVVEKAKIEARKKGYAVTEQSLQNGSIKVQILEGT